MEGGRWVRDGPGHVIGEVGELCDGSGGEHIIKLTISTIDNDNLYS